VIKQLRYLFWTQTEEPIVKTLSYTAFKKGKEAVYTISQYYNNAIIIFVTITVILMSDWENSYVDINAKPRQLNSVLSTKPNYYGIQINNFDFQSFN
jgi:hypothetical protein